MVMPLALAKLEFPSSVERCPRGFWAADEGDVCGVRGNGDVQRPAAPPSRIYGYGAGEISLHTPPNQYGRNAALLQVC